MTKVYSRCGGGLRPYFSILQAGLQSDVLNIVRAS